MQDNRKFGAITSSVDPEKIALTVSGLMISSASIIVIVLGHLGFPVSVEQVTNFAGALGTTIGFIVTVYGLIRKLLVKIATRNNPPA